MPSKGSHVNRYTGIATHTNHFLSLNRLYSTVLVLSFKNITVKQKPNLLLNVSLCIRPLTFIIEIFRLVGTAW